MNGLSRSRPAALGFLFVVTSVLYACGGSSGGGGGGGTPGIGGIGAPSPGVTLEVTLDPQVAWISANGKTQVIVQFSAHDNNGQPLTEDQVEVEFEVDGDPIDVESVLSQQSDELEVNIYFAMVLDASYSMTQHNPPAFEPMKTAASETYRQVLDLWSTRPGEVRFSLIWFEEVMNQSMFNIGAARDWEPADILTIPTPAAGTATKLDSAVKTMADYLQSEFDSGVFNGDRDQYVMLVFSDGADNYSFFDNSALNAELTTSSGASYRQFGTAPTTPEEAGTAVAAHPKLTAQLIGIGSQIDRDNLDQIAEVSDGKVFTDLNTANVDQLFEQALREFTTLQTRGAEIPLPPGDYTIAMTVRNLSGGESGRYTFTIHAGDAGAGVVSIP